MDTNLNLYPDKRIAQCINAISLLSDANEALSSLKFEINEFVNDSYIVIRYVNSMGLMI